MEAALQLVPYKSFSRHENHLRITPYLGRLGAGDLRGSGLGTMLDGFRVSSVGKSMSFMLKLLEIQKALWDPKP